MKYYILGPLEVTADGGQPVDLKAKRLRALLGVLLLHADRVVPLERIIDGIWPDEPPRSAIENVRTYVFQLRSMCQNPSDRNRLESHPGGYRLRVEPEQLDLQRFTTQAANGRHALGSGALSSAATLLASALDLWRGAPLAELELGSAMRAKTTALEEHRWQVQGDLINTRLALGERAELVSTLQELIGERPFDEGLWCSLMSVLHAVGRTCDALTAFARARTLLVTELGVEPGPALRRVHAAVLEGAEVLGVPSFVGATTTRAVFALHQLPAAVPDFVGRRTELTRIQTLAERAAEGALDHVQIVLVSGSPGVGKTATAVAAGTNMRQACPDGEVLIDLRGSTAQPKDPGAALGDVLTAVGLSTDAIPVSLEHRVALYRSILVERRMLIMLDDAANAEQVTPLVPGLGQSMLIVTSRRWLTGVAADLHLRLEALPRPDALEMLARLIGPDRVEREPEAAASIVEGCGRLPSAIRIAGARLAALSHHPLRFLASRLRDHDRVLDELSVDGMSLRQLFDTCYASLDAQSRRSFWACGLCPSELITAANVGEALRLPVPTADRQLERLIHEGLLSCGGPVSGVPTYRMPVVLHAYARERLADGSRQVRAS